MKHTVGKNLYFDKLKLWLKLIPHITRGAKISVSFGAKIKVEFQECISQVPWDDFIIIIFVNSRHLPITMVFFGYK